MNKQLALAALFSLSCTISNTSYAADEQPVLFTADLSNAGATASPSPIPFYPNECAKLPAPGSDANALGKAVLLYYPKSKTLHYAIAFSGLSGPAMMSHIHSSPNNAPIVQTFCGKPPPDVNNLGHSGHALNGKACPLTTEGFLKGEYVLKGNPSLKMTPEQEEQQLMAGELFINFHTCKNMPGEIKGAIVKSTK
ncbi:MAG: CHRD domain-containing protein [Burkholderiales bacterium]|nr:CHRD domain-containing protein [Burkholderiales bacterium]